MFSGILVEQNGDCEVLMLDTWPRQSKTKDATWLRQVV